jgi:hypothetical protein
MRAKWYLFLMRLLYARLSSSIQATCSILIRMVRLLLTKSVQTLAVYTHTLVGSFHSLDRVLQTYFIREYVQ